MLTILTERKPLIIALFILTLAFNHTLFTLINFTGSFLPDALWVFVTNLGDTAIALSIILAFYSYSQDRGARLLILAIIGTLVIQGLKHLFGIDRPAVALMDIGGFNQVGSALKSPSFPSGHTATAFIGAGILAAQYKNPRLTQFLVVMAAMIGLSRIMIAAHWPFDVLVGATLGWLIGFYGYQRLMDFNLSSLLWTLIGALTVAIVMINQSVYQLPYSEFSSTTVTEWVGIGLAAIGVLRWGYHIFVAKTEVNK